MPSTRVKALGGQESPRCGRHWPRACRMVTRSGSNSSRSTAGCSDTATRSASIRASACCSTS
jgi:hypothetical protein